jgi:hypothetical protein
MATELHCIYNNRIVFLRIFVDTPHRFVLTARYPLTYLKGLAGVLLTIKHYTVAMYPSVWKGLPGTNTLAYYENPSITAVKSFIVQAWGLP